MNLPTSNAVAYIMLFIAPAFFTTNVVFGRMLLSVEPFTLAFLRWMLASAILLVFSRPYWSQMLSVFRENIVLCMTTGFLAFWICGGMVYYALHYTTASNGTLIYTTPPVLIIAIEAIWRGRNVSTREIIGIIAAVLGASVIILRGSIQNLLLLDFNTGDLIFVLAAISWAIYSVFLKKEQFTGLPTLPLLALLACCGSVTLFPFALWETAATGNFPNTANQWYIISAIVVFSSLLSFLSFQYGVKVLGASIAGIFMYLLPPWGLFFAWFLLSEKLEHFHIAGTLLIMAGIVVATFPKRLLKK